MARSWLAALLGLGTLQACAARKVAPEVLNRRDAAPELELPAGARPANGTTTTSDLDDGGSDCGGLDIPTQVTRDARASLLLIFDQSGSMQGSWSATTKIEAAKAAVIAAVEPLAEQLTVGALFLPTQACSPTPPDGGAVAPIDAAEQIAFAAGPDFLKAWRAKWASDPDGGGQGTPLNEGFDRAQLALEDARSRGILPGKVAVLVFTDGVPNCDADPIATGIPTLDEPERAAQWLSQDIRTYVVGLPGAEGVRLLDDISKRGGTNAFINPTDPMQLQEKLRGLVEDQVSRFATSCTVDLDPAPPHPSQVRAFVRREGREEEVARGESWNVQPDGRSLELLGTLCSDAMRGDVDALRLVYGCVMGPE